MSRPIITPDEFDAAERAVPAPPGMTWQLDPAYAGDRMRLFDAHGDVCGAYAGGTWWANIREPAVTTVTGHAVNGSLISAMRHALNVAMRGRSSPPKRYYITYKVPSITGDQVHEAGPYDTIEEARENYAEVFTYTGVEQVEIVGRPVTQTGACV